MNQLDPRRSRPLFAGARTGDPPASPLTLRELLREDVGRYIDLDTRPSRLAILRALLQNEGVWPLFAYRLGRCLMVQRGRGLSRLWVWALWCVQFVLETASRLLWDIRLDLAADIGPGFYVGHFKSIYVGQGVRIGSHCNIGQMCFVAATPEGAPVIGDRVYLGVGAKVLGPLRVGDDAALGANAVVLEDVPASAVVVGNPARVVSMKGSLDFISIKKRDRELGPSRLTAVSPHGARPAQEPEAPSRSWAAGPACQGESASPERESSVEGDEGRRR